MYESELIKSIKKAHKLNNTTPFESLADLTEKEVQELCKDFSSLNITLSTEDLIFIISKVGLNLEFHVETPTLTHISLKGCGEFIAILPTQTGWNFKLNITKKTQIDLYKNKLKYKTPSKKRHLSYLIYRLRYESGEITRDPDTTLSYNDFGREIKTYIKKNKSARGNPTLNKELFRLTLPIQIDREEFEANLSEEKDRSTRYKKRQHFDKKKTEYVGMAISQLRIIAQPHKLD